MALFGSVLRDDFRPDGDVDVLVTFAPTPHGASETFSRCADELREAFGREVDLVEQRSLVNPFRRRSILAANR